VAIVEDYNRLMACVDKSDCVKGSCTISKHFGPSHSEHCCHSHVFWFRIITLIVQNVIGEGPQGKAN
jgi:hypothetical protein